MSWDLLILVVTALLAVVAVGAAVIAVRAVKRLEAPATSVAPEVVPRTEVEIYVPRPVELEPRTVEGRVIVPPTQAQVVNTALGRPAVRAKVYAAGLRHAFRAESRDRISALVRREYRRRRNGRLKAGRRAARTWESS